MKKKKTDKNQDLLKLMFGTNSLQDPMQGYMDIKRQRMSENPGFIENPNTALADNQIRQARAMQKANTGWNQALDIFGNLALQVGGSMMNKGMAKGQGVSENGFNWGNLLNQGIGILGTVGNQQSQQGFAFGGQIPGQVPVEIEGKEVGETPDGQVFQAEGPSHEGGGIDTVLPEATKMYSKRIKVDGVSMADRKKGREKKEMTLEELLESNSTDKLLKNSLGRTKKANELEEQKDLEIQEVVSELMKGTDAENTNEKKLQGGTGPGGILGDPTMWKNIFKQLNGEIVPNFTGTSDDYHIIDDGVTEYKSKIPSLATPGIVSEGKLYSGLNYKDAQSEADRVASDLGMFLDLNNPKSVKEYQKALGFTGKDIDGKFGKNTLARTQKYATPIKGLEMQGLQLTKPQMSIPDLDLSRLQMPTGNVGDGKKLQGKEKDSLLKKIFGGNKDGMTMGDMIGMAGNLYSTFAPMKNTLESRATDTPNVNMFKEYGKDGLKVINDAKGHIAGQRDSQLQDLELSRSSTTNRLRNSARGINTMRALDLATNAQTNEQQTKIHNAFTQQMMQLLGQETQMENQQDQTVMQGEQNRDLADRQDKDNFFTQMAQNIATKGRGLQEIGKNTNLIKKRKEDLKDVDKLREWMLSNADSKVAVEFIEKFNEFIKSQNKANKLN